MNRLLMVMVMLALGAVLAACGTADDPEVPPPTSTELPASATDAPSGAPLKRYNRPSGPRRNLPI